MTISINGQGSFATIQEAINAASSGDTIGITAGTYNETVTLKSGITLVGAGNGDNPLTDTIINGSMVVPAMLEGTTVGKACRFRRGRPWCLTPRRPRR
jgi:pectin methylesterase-like acyl-CoA thioesterase